MAVATANGGLTIGIEGDDVQDLLTRHVQPGLDEREQEAQRGAAGPDERPEHQRVAQDAEVDGRR